MSHPFLSDEWIEAARVVRDRYANEGAVFPHKLRINQIVTGSPFGQSSLLLYIDTTAGHVTMGKGQLDGADCTVTTDYETARKLFVDQDAAAGMQAFMSGKIKVQGDMTKLLALQSAPADDVARRIAAEIKLLTA